MLAIFDQNTNYMENVHIEFLSERYEWEIQGFLTLPFLQILLPLFSLMKVINFWRALEKVCSEFDNHEFLNHEMRVLLVCIAPVTQEF